MIKSYHVLAATLAVLFLVPAGMAAKVFQFEVLGASDEWVMIRENIPAAAADTAACTYPGLDPSEFVGATVHFFPVSAEAKRGRLVPLEKPGSSMPLYAHGNLGEGCTSAVEGERRWKEIADHAKSLGIEIASTPPAAVVLGEAVPASACVLLGGVSSEGSPCRKEFKQVLKRGTIRIAVSLTAIPEAPNERVCQFIGHRFEAAIQVAGLDFAKAGSSIAPGGFANHYDCRGQQFDPLRIYALDGVSVLVGGFSGTNIADRNEYPFVMIFPTRPVR